MTPAVIQTKSKHSFQSLNTEGNDIKILMVSSCQSVLRHTKSPQCYTLMIICKLDEKLNFWSFKSMHGRSHLNLICLWQRAVQWQELRKAHAVLLASWTHLTNTALCQIVNTRVFLCQTYKQVGAIHVEKALVLIHPHLHHAGCV